MTKRYTAAGLIATAAYAAAFMFLLLGRIQDFGTMPLNEIGDFLAGAFGPVALLWLVLGYFQQGVELKQNTKALELQAQELRNSVAQQRELVEVSRQQFLAEMEALQYERARIEEARRPRIVSEGFGGRHFNDGRTQFEGNFKNFGSAVTNVSIDFSPSMGTMDPSHLPLAERSTRTRQLRVRKPASAGLRTGIQLLGRIGATWSMHLHRARESDWAAPRAHLRFSKLR